MSYAADDTLANTGSFQTQVRCSIVKAAVAIASEARTTRPNVDIKRENLASRVLNNPTAFVVPFSYACVEASGLTGTPTDVQVDTAVATAWNGMAGVLSSD
jgi:hypothetical protein